MNLTTVSGRKRIGRAWPLALLLFFGAAPARAADSAALQFTIPAPDPVAAGETLALQALAINTGNEKWLAGSYYWIGEVYDLEYKLLARTEQISPQEEIAPGAVAAVSIPFRVPETMEGRKLYRVFLIKDDRRMVESDFKPFQVTEKAIAPPPEAVDYHLEGNVTFSYKNTSRDKWAHHAGATSINMVGKIKDASYLLNTYLLHEPGKAVDPFIIVMNLYAPWGTIYAGDISPTLTPLSVSGQGMRGGMLEQRRGIFNWTLVGGQTIESLPGTSSANGRYSRTLYAGKGQADLPWGFKSSLNYFLSADESGSLNTDPKSPRYRGPTLVPQRNSGAGFGLNWEPITKLAFAAYYQQNSFYQDVSRQAVKDTAWRGEVSFARKRFKFKSYAQRAGSDFHALGAPGVVGDRMTVDSNISVYPSSWYSLSLAANQYTDNLKSDPRRLTTKQQVMSVGNSFSFKTGTNIGLNVSQNKATGKPMSQLNNQTTTMGTSLGQSFGTGHSVNMNVQLSQFKDKTKLAHDLDTQTAGFSSTWRLPRRWNAAMGLSVTEARDKVDGSKRSNQSASPSVAFPIAKAWTGQIYGTLSNSKNTSRLFPSQVSSTALNSEFTFTRPQTSLTVGIGANKTQDKILPSRSLTEATALMRWSYSF